jgi:hypothetical protein
MIDYLRQRRRSMAARRDVLQDKQPGNNTTMTHIWVTTPETGLPQEVQAIAAALQDEVTTIEALAPENACRLCGAVADLTQEHVPAKKAGNAGRVISATIDLVRSHATGWIAWATRRVQRVVIPSLCSRCNNNTGSWYNPAYVRLVRAVEPFARAENAGKTCSLDLDLHPQRAAKQALTSIIATAQPGLTTRYPVLRELLTQKEAAGPIHPVRLWLYVRANPGMRRTGLVAAVNTSPPSGQIVAEMSSQPLGWIATFGDRPVPGTIDVTAWTEVGFHVRQKLRLDVPCQLASGPYPAAFGSLGG